MKELRILGVLLTDRINDAPGIQKALTKYGCAIKTRLGMHEVNENFCSNYGLILLELTGDPSEWDKLEAELIKFTGVQLQKISFQV